MRMMKLVMRKWLLLVVFAAAFTRTRGDCVRRPTVDCWKVDVSQCDAMRTCTRYCRTVTNASGLSVDERCPQNQDQFCAGVDIYNPPTPECFDLNTNGSAVCESHSDCLWVPGTPAAAVVEGPFAEDCNRRSIMNIPGSTFGSLWVEDICLTKPPEDWTCAQNNDGTAVVARSIGSNTTTLGRWYVMRVSWTGPLRISTKDSKLDVVTTLTVFQANETNPGRLFCVSSDSDTNANAHDANVVVNAVKDSFYFVLASVVAGDGALNVTEGDALSGFGLGAEPATGAAACELECYSEERSAQRQGTNVTCSCNVDPLNDQVTNLQVRRLCELCHYNASDPKEPSFCVLESFDTAYDSRGQVLHSKYCYHITQGYRNESVCLLTENEDPNTAVYTVGDQNCTTVLEPIDACQGQTTPNQLFPTFDCSAIEPGAIFNHCAQEREGYEGVFAVDRALFVDLVATEVGQCYPSIADGSTTPAPTPQTSGQDKFSGIWHMTFLWLTILVFIS